MPAVPEELMKKLHEANEQFHQARMAAENIGQESTERRVAMAKSLRDAEANLEAVTREIDACLPPVNSDVKPKPNP